jgi:hypothetical protein
MQLDGGRDEQNVGPTTIIPGVSIGPIRLGGLEDALQGPKNEHGHIIVPAGLSALVSGEGILDIWIDNLRTFRNPVFVAGKMLPRNASFEDLNALLGPCDEVSRTEKGTTFNCACDLSFRLASADPISALTVWVKRR